MTKYYMRELGDPVLRVKSQPVQNITPDISKTIDNMAQILQATTNGAALAAPQIGVLKKIVVIDNGSGILELINPEIIETDGEQVGPEACLSLPGLWGIVKRADYVKVKAIDRYGKGFIIEGSGFMARCLQHEIDHLEGILFIDKVEPGQLYKEHTNEPLDVQNLIGISNMNR